MQIQTLIAPALLSVSVGFLPSSPALAQETNVSTDQSSADQDKVICRRFAVTGTRVKKKFCQTRAQWDAQAAAAKASGLNIQDSGGVNSVRPDGG